MRRARHHRAVAGQREDAVDRQSEQAGGVAPLQVFGLRMQVLLQLRRAGVVHLRRAYGVDRCAIQEGAGSQCRDLGAHGV
ncbi:hypothetical protein D3C80_2121410 [compost metagenome]